MKANEVPEKLYIHKSQFWGLMANEHNITKDGIEYIRADAFIEKACFYIKNMVLDITYSDVDDNDNYNIDKFIEDFKNYMKGE